MTVRVCSIEEEASIGVPGGYRAMRRRGRSSSEPGRGVIALAWYTLDQWILLKNTAADQEVLDDTYGDWLEGATQRFEELQATGCDIRKVHIDVSELTQWCRFRGVPLDGKSRAEFAADKAEGLAARSKPGR
jgi:hypothetical protein